VPNPVSSGFLWKTSRKNRGKKPAKPSFGRGSSFCGPTGGKPPVGSRTLGRPPKFAGEPHALGHHFGGNTEPGAGISLRIGHIPSKGAPGSRSPFLGPSLSPGQGDGPPIGGRKVPRGGRGSTQPLHCGILMLLPGGPLGNQRGRGPKPKRNLYLGRHVFHVTHHILPLCPGPVGVHCSDDSGGIAQGSGEKISFFVFVDRGKNSTGFTIGGVGPLIKKIGGLTGPSPHQLKRLWGLWGNKKQKQPPVGATILNQDVPVFKKGGRGVAIPARAFWAVSIHRGTSSIVGGKVCSPPVVGTLLNAWEPHRPSTPNGWGGTGIISSSPKTVSKNAGGFWRGRGKGKKRRCYRG